MFRARCACASLQQKVTKMGRSQCLGSFFNVLVIVVITLYSSLQKSFWMGVSFILKAKATVHAIGFPPAYSFVSRRLQSLSLLSLYSGDELFLLVVRKQATEMTCRGLRSTACGRYSAKAPRPSLAFLMKLVKILRERF